MTTARNNNNNNNNTNNNNTNNNNNNNNNNSHNNHNTTAAPPRSHRSGSPVRDKRACASKSCLGRCGRASVWHKKARSQSHLEVEE